jgi:prevent-host-death family protein
VSKITIRELRNRGGHVIDRAERGERITITRDGREVAELRPLRRALSGQALIERSRGLGRVDADDLRADLDRVVDPGL